MKHEPKESIPTKHQLSVSSNGSEWMKQTHWSIFIEHFGLSVSSNGSEWMKLIGHAVYHAGDFTFSILKRIGVDETSNTKRYRRPRWAFSILKRIGVDETFSARPAGRAHF